MVRYGWKQHRWEVTFLRKEFRIYSVQPGMLFTDRPAKLFNEVLNKLLFGSENVKEKERENDNLEFTETFEQFDLLTFPEAFLPAPDLIKTMKSIESVGVDFGLIHTGLNPEGPEVDHLFNKSQVEALLNDLENLQTTQTEDLEPLKDWIASDYQQGDRINLGILFCKDSEDKIRVCLHAKIARSKFEVSLSADKHIREVHLIQAIKLIDSSRREIPVRLAPLICSDFIFAPGEISLDLPVHAISKGPPPTNQVEWVDHIDLISVINCSPTGPKGKPTSYLEEENNFWKEEFSGVIERIVSCDFGPRICKSCVLFTNYADFPMDNERAKQAGISGVFVPMDKIESYNLKGLQQEIYCRLPEQIREAIGGLKQRRWLNIREIPAMLKHAEQNDQSSFKSWNNSGTFFALPYEEKRTTMLSYDLSLPLRSGASGGKVVDVSLYDVILDGDEKVILNKRIEI